MKRAFGLVIVAVCAVWSMLLFDPRRDRDKTASSAKRAPSTDEPSVTTQAPTRSSTRSQQSVEREAEARVSTSAPRKSAQAARPSSSGDVQVIGAQASAPSRAATGPLKPESIVRTEVDPKEGTGELGEGIMSPDFVELETDYSREPRDGAWAMEQERRIRELLYASDIADHVVIVHCQATVCRIHLEPHGSDPFGDLLRVPGLREHASLDSSTPYSLNGSELVVYARPKAPLVEAR